jgi:hypothetical protein
LKPEHDEKKSIQNKSLCGFRNPVEQQHEGSMKEMVRYIAEALADEPESVDVQEIQEVIAQLLS